MILNNLILLQFFKSALKILKIIFVNSGEIAVGTKFLWLNKSVSSPNNLNKSISVLMIYQLIKKPYGDLLS